jgi:hypothetical protein
MNKQDKLKDRQEGIYYGPVTNDGNQIRKRTAPMFLCSGLAVQE